MPALLSRLGSSQQGVHSLKLMQIPSCSLHLTHWKEEWSKWVQESLVFPLQVKASTSLFLSQQLLVCDHPRSLDNQILVPVRRERSHHVSHHLKEIALEPLSDVVQAIDC
ncbi:hypothetical protein Tco_1394115 [Tanacetum coccineum]